MSNGYTILDVRSPGEFLQGHIPGATNLPLFSDEERKVVGTLYKQEGKTIAIQKGLEFVGTKMKFFTEKAIDLKKENKIFIHCWRGGMRSESMAWLIEKMGMEVFLLEGGYKKFRNAALELFTKTYRFKVLGGPTGSGKTDILKELLKNGQACVDLEGLANHQGSAFGSMGGKPQPTQEQFENDLALELLKWEKEDFIWIEDESITIGNIVIPKAIWEQIRGAEIINLLVDKHQRVNNLVREYSKLPPEFLENAIEKISKKLGYDNAKKAKDFLIEGNFEGVVEEVLKYYDKAYLKGLNTRSPETIITLSKINFECTYLIHSTKK